MQALAAPALFALLTLSAANARADAGQAAAVGSSLSEILTFATLGTVTTQAQAAQVTRDGADYRVRLPLKGFATPADAAVNAVARPEDGGAWAITSMTFPSSGTVETRPSGDGSETAAQRGPVRIAYSIGEQAIHASIDPSFAQPSSFAATLGAIVLRSDQAGERTEQAFDKYTMDGTLSAEAQGQLNFVSRGSGTNWHLTGHGRNGFDTDSLVRKLSGHVSVQGLNQAQGTRLLAAARAVMGAASTPGQPPGLSAGQRDDVRAMIDSLSGLLANFAADETLDDIRFNAGANSGTLGRVHVDIAGSAADDRLNARLDMAADDFAMASMPVDLAAYVPRHFDLRSALAGVPAERLMALLRAATSANPDQAALQAELTSLLSDPAARIGIEALTFDSGPVRVTASARVVPQANGSLGAVVHVSATGVDALIAQAQGKPALQRGLPLMFIAKGMGRPEGDATVWDITVGDGVVTVNGTPFGQPTAHTR